MPLDAQTYIAAVQSEGERIAAVARTDRNAAVPGCPGWTVTNLLGHLGRVYRSVAAHVTARATEMIPGDNIERPPDGDAIVGFFEKGHAAVLAALSQIEPAEPVWSWSTDHTGGFYLRRMANETAVHRWDAESATGEPGPIDPELATDGIDELLTVVLPFAIARWERPDPGGSLHLHRTDGPGEWLAELVSGQLTVRHEHAKGDVAVRAGASDLVLALWERIPLDVDGIEVFGDTSVAHEWMALAR